MKPRNRHLRTMAGPLAPQEQITALTDRDAHASLDHRDSVGLLLGMLQRRARKSRPPRWPIGCRGQAYSSSSASKRAVKIGSGSAGGGRQPSQAMGMGRLTLPG